MKLSLTWFNTFWLLVPILFWNLALASKLPQTGFHDDSLVPVWLGRAESTLRLLVFAIPLLLAVKPQPAGWIVYALGVAIYFASWLPLWLVPDAAWSLLPAGWLAPFVTPILFLVGISLLAQSWAYFTLSVLFVIAHTAHGLFSFRLL